MLHTVCVGYAQSKISDVLLGLFSGVEGTYQAWPNGHVQHFPEAQL